MELYLFCPKCKARGTMTASETVMVELDENFKKVGETRISISKCGICEHTIGPNMDHGDTAKMSKN